MLDSLLIQSRSLPDLPLPVELIAYNTFWLLYWLFLSNRKALTRLTGSPLRAVYLFATVHAVFTYWRFLGSKKVTDSTELGVFAPMPLLGLALVILGQILNLAVYWRIGIKGVYYATAFGIDVRPRSLARPRLHLTRRPRRCRGSPASRSTPSPTRSTSARR